MIHTNVARLPVAGSGKASNGKDRRPRIADLMRSSAYAVAPETPATAVATLMTTTGCSGVPVVDREGRVVGVVTEADLVRHQLGSGAASLGSTLSATVGDVMSPDPLLAPSRYELDVLVGLMLSAGTPIVPIVDDGRLVGMIDMRDVVRLAGSANARGSATGRASG